MLQEQRPGTWARTTNDKGDAITVRVLRRIPGCQRRIGNADYLFVCKFGNLQFLNRRSELDPMPLAHAAKTLFRDAGFGQ